MKNPLNYHRKPNGRLAGLYQTLQSKNVVIVLLILAGIFVFIPARWSKPMEKFCQAWLAPSGRLTILAAQSISGKKTTAELSDSTINDAQMLRMFSTISLRLQQLEQENQNLLKMRQQIGSASALVPSRVIGFDSLGLASIEIDKGSFAKITEGLPVLISVPLEILQQENIDPRLAISAGILVGTVAYDPGPYTSRVKLISSSDIHFSGSVIRFSQNDGKTQIIAPAIHVQGAPKSKELLGKLNANIVPAHRGVKVGDFVVPTELEKFNLPCSVIVGQVSKVNSNSDNRQFVDLEIQPLFQKTQLNKVYVLIP